MFKLLVAVYCYGRDGIRTEVIEFASADAADAAFSSIKGGFNDGNLTVRVIKLYKDH